MNTTEEFTGIGQCDSTVPTGRGTTWRCSQHQGHKGDHGSVYSSSPRWTDGPARYSHADAELAAAKVANARIQALVDAWIALIDAGNAEGARIVRELLNTTIEEDSSK